MKKKFVDWVNGAKSWIISIGVVLTITGTVGNIIYANLLSPKVKCQIQEELVPYNERLHKVENRIDWIVFMQERSLNRDTLSNLRREYFMRKRNEE